MGTHTLDVRVAPALRRTAVTAAFALAAPVTWLAAPAEACTCSAYGNLPDPAAAQRGGGFLAVVTQINDKGNGLALRVDRSAGPTQDNYKPFKEPPPPLQTTLTGKAAASGCGYVPYQAVKAVSPYRLKPAESKKGAWSAAGCRDLNVGDALQQIAGDAPTTSTTAPVAVLAGRFGNSSLVAVDERGEVVAWNRQKSRIANLAACPGGRTVVSWDSSYADKVLTVRDARTLAQVRTLSLPANTSVIHGLRCDDTDGTRAQVLVAAEKASDGSTLYSVTETTTAAVPVAAHVTAPQWDGAGFIGTSDHEPSRLALVRIARNGEVRLLRADLPSLEHLALGRDRRTAAAIAATDWPEGRAGSVITFETRNGKLLASWVPETKADALAWTGNGHLLVRVGHVNEEAPYRAGMLEVRDRSLKPIATRASAPGSLAAVGDVAVGYGDTRFSLAPAQGKPQVVDNLWLVGTTHVASLLDTDPRTAGLSTDDRLLWVLGGLGLSLVGTTVATRRRRTT